MFYPRNAPWLGGCLILLASWATHAQETLDLAVAERLALARAPGYARQQAASRAAAERTVHEGRLPDPQLTLGAANVPTDSFNLRESDMTMTVVGVRQAFPPGETLNLRTRRARLDHRIQEAQLELERRNLLRDVRRAWYELRFVEDTLRIIDRVRPLLERQRTAAEARYRSAQDTQEVVWQTRQALARLADREQEFRARRQRVQAGLARWIGREAYLPLSTHALNADIPAATFDPGKNPEWLAAQARLDRSRVDVDLARQQYKPGFALSLSYGHRQARPTGDERSDLLTAMVTMDLPLFRAKRQDRRLAEQQLLASGARHELDDVRRVLTARYAATHADYVSLTRRITLYENELLPAARREFTVASSGFARDQVTLRRARVRALETEIELARLKRDLAYRQTELLHLTGETKP